MPRISVVRRYNASPSRCFEVMTDLDNCANNISKIQAVEILTEGKVQSGTRWKETRKTGKREQTVEMWFDKWVQDKHYRVVSDEGGTLRLTTFDFEEKDGKCEVTLRCEWEKKGLILTVMNPIIKRMRKKGMKRDMDDFLKVINQES